MVGPKKQRRELTPEGFMEKVALEPGLNARVGFFISGDCRKRHSLLGKGKARMLPLLPLPLSQQDYNFF